MTKEQKHQMDVRASKALANTDWREDNECNAYIDGYEQCIIDQRKIDIEKAIEWLDNLLDGRPFLPDGWQDELKIVMEED